mmetsp:Transcript_43583/g.137892  ORF Transcript_43583/g.137892 Transcript_43583/m.137892 type:complete len:144 (-) Transcript_43583:814-1245(-)
MQHRRHSCPDVLLIHSSCSVVKHTRDDATFSSASHRKDFMPTPALSEVSHHKWERFRGIANKVYAASNFITKTSQKSEVLFHKLMTINFSAIDVNGNLTLNGSHKPIDLHCRIPNKSSIDEGGNFVQPTDSDVRYKEFTFGHL